MSRALFLSVVMLTSVATAQIDVSVSTSKATYVLGEPMRILVTARNNGSEGVTLEFSTAYQASYVMDGSYVPVVVAAQVLTERHIPAGESYTWVLDHDLAECPLDYGTHRVVGKVIGVASSRAAAEFEIVEGEPMEEDIVIDFTPPSEDDPLDTGSPGWVYASWAVHFSTSRNDDEAIEPGLTEDEGNYYLQIGRCTYPPGFNIIADLEFPISGASAQVSTAAGETVTMIAKDADGNVVHTAVSPVVPEVGEFVAIPEFRVDTPISSLEWWPSNERASVMIDDLSLFAMPEDDDADDEDIGDDADDDDSDDAADDDDSDDDADDDDETDDDDPS